MEKTIQAASNGTAADTYTTAAQQHVEQLRAMRATLPNFTLPETADARRRLAAVASLPPAFVEIVAMAIKNNPPLEQGSPGADLIRERMAYAAAFEAVADEFEAMGHFLRHSITAARNQAGTAALTGYELAKRLAKQPGHAGLVEYVADMTRALGLRERAAKSKATRKRKKEEAGAGHTTATPPHP